MASKRKIEMREPDAVKESASKESSKIPNRAEDDLRKLAVDYVENQIFTSANIHQGNESCLGLVFMVVSLGAFADYTDEDRKDIGLLFEYYSKAGPRCINGMPMFFSCQVLNQHDNTLFWRYVELLEAQKKAFLEHKTAW